MANSDTTADESAPTGESNGSIKRRGALTLLGTALAGLAAGSASGQEGRQGGRQPWYDWTADVDANGHSLTDLDELEADQLTNSAFHDRPTWSTETLTLEVGSDFPTLQECVNAVPLVPYASVEIDIPSGTDLSSEDVVVPQTVLGTGSVEGRGYEHKISITGDQDDPSNCPVGSIVVSGVNGGIVSVDGVEFQRANPHSNDANGFSAFYTHQARIHNCAFAGGQNGVMSYGSNLEIHQVDFGDGVLEGDAISVKHNGFVQEQRAGPDPPTSGSVPGHAYVPTSGWITTVRETNVPSTLTGDAGLIDYSTGRGGLVTTELWGDQSIMRFLGSYQWEGDVHQVENGKGFITHSPDGTPYRIRVDNEGAVVTEEL